MRYTKEVAKHFREIYTGKNWTAGYLKEHIDDVTWKEAITKIHELNTIAALVYHIHYYVREANKVFDGYLYDAIDEQSFSHPEIHSEKDWKDLVDTIFNEAEEFAQKIENVSDDILFETFENKYGNSGFRLLHGIIEHAHYHVGQIVLLKKLIRNKT